MKRVNFDAARRACEPAIRRLLHLYWRFARAMTLGVRAVVIDPQGRIFLVKHSYVSGWHLPGGGVEAGETIAEALARELREEGNIELCAPPRLHGMYFNDRDSRRDHVALFVVRDQLAGESGSLEVPGASGSLYPPRPVGQYTFGWHRLRLGLRDGETHLDPTRFTVVGHVEYRGRRLEFHSGRVRFSDALWDDIGRHATQQLAVDMPSITDTTVWATVNITRSIVRQYVYGARSRSASMWVVQHHDVLNLTLSQRSPDGSWVVVARGS